MVAPGHPLAGRRQVSLAQVAAYPLALPAHGSTLRQLLDISCSRQGLALEPVVTSDHLYPLIQYVAHTQAVTFCGKIALRQQLQAGSVVAIALRDREMNERHSATHACRFVIGARPVRRHNHGGSRTEALTPCHPFLPCLTPLPRG